MRVRLTDAAALRPRKREYTVWDSRTSGLGVRVRPSGHRSYVYLRSGRKASLGPAALKSIDEARRECVGLAAGKTKVPTFAGVRRGSVEGGLLGALQEGDTLGEVR